MLGCIRRTNEKITEDYDEIDRRDPPVFINNTRTKVIVAAGKTASLECRVMNIGDRTVRSNSTSYLNTFNFAKYLRDNSKNKNFNFRTISEISSTLIK